MVILVKPVVYLVAMIAVVWAGLVSLAVVAGPMIMGGGQLTFVDAEDIHLLDIERQLVFNLTQGHDFASYPRWTPDGEHILFSDHTGRLYIMDATGRQVHELDKARLIAVAPEQQHMIYQSWLVDWGRFQIFPVEITGLTVEQNRDAGQRVSEVVWLDQSHELRYVEKEEAFFRVHAFDLDDQGDTVLAEWIDTEFNPVTDATLMSPRGTHVILVRSNLRQGIHLIDIGTGRDRSVGEFHRLGHPSWSPDGRSIAAVARVSDSSEALTITGIDDLQSRQLRIFQQRNVRILNWTDDGGAIMVALGNLSAQRLALVDVETGAIERVIELPGRRLNFPVWRPGA